MTSTAASSRDTAASTVVGCRSVTSFTWPPSVQAVTVPPSKPSTNASPPPTKNPRSSSSPSCEKCSQPSTLCSAIALHGSRDPPEPTTQLLTPAPHREGNATSRAPCKKRILCERRHIADVVAELVSYLSIVPHMRSFDVPPKHSAPLARGHFLHRSTSCVESGRRADR